MGINNNGTSSLPTRFMTGSVTNFVQSTKPTANAVGDLWYKPTDGTKWYWNGNYWLSPEDVILGSHYNGILYNANGAVWGTTISGRNLVSVEAGIFINSCQIAYYLAGIGSGSNYWAVSFFIVYDDFTIETLTIINTGVSSGDKWLKVRNTVSSPRSTLTKSVALIYAEMSRVGSAPATYMMCNVSIKWVHP